MNDSRRGLQAIVLAAIVLCIVASLTGANAKAGDDRSGGLRIATVDLLRVQDEYKFVKSFKDAAEKQGKDFQTEVDVMQRNSLLPEADQRALVELAIKEKATPTGLTKADADKKKTLETQSEALRADYVKLQQTPAGLFKDGDEKRLKDYTRMELDMASRLKSHQTQLTQELETKTKTLDQSYRDNLEKALTDVAKKNNYNLILNNQVAPHADADCTKDVITLMNK